MKAEAMIPGVCCLFFRSVYIVKKCNRDRKVEARGRRIRNVIVRSVDGAGYPGAAPKPHSRFHQSGADCALGGPLRRWLGGCFLRPWP
jgi:hypothetical protein